MKRLAPHLPPVPARRSVWAIALPLLALTAGMVTAARARGELFGFDRARDISSRPAEELADAAKQWGQNDDITVVTVRRAIA